jgi:hypothetical protein
MAEPGKEPHGPDGDALRHRPLDALQAGLAALPAPLKESGRLSLLVLRRADGVRETPERVLLSPEHGVPGDGWTRRPPRDPEAQLAVMRRDVAELIANGQPLTLFGDNLFVDLDLSAANLPAGTRIRVGEALVEATPSPRNCCLLFKALRPGRAALRPGARDPPAEPAASTGRSSKPARPASAIASRCSRACPRGRAARGGGRLPAGRPLDGPDVRRPGPAPPRPGPASGPCSRRSPATTAASPRRRGRWAHAVGAAMAIALVAAALQLVRGADAGWRRPRARRGPAALAFARGAAERDLGARSDRPRSRARSRAICRDHLFCLAAIVSFLALACWPRRAEPPPAVLGSPRARWGPRCRRSLSPARRSRCLAGANLRVVLLPRPPSALHGRGPALHCRGRGLCGTCAVRIEGPVSEPTEAELQRFRAFPHQPDSGLRLACQCSVQGDVTVTKYDGLFGQHVDAAKTPER